MDEQCESTCEEPREEIRPLGAGRLVGGGPAPDCGPYREEARIQAVENGFIVRVGCKTFVSKDWAEISQGLEEYWKDPRQAEKKYSRKI